MKKAFFTVVVMIWVYVLQLFAFAKVVEELPVTFSSMGHPEASYTIESFEIKSVEKLCALPFCRIGYTVQAHGEGTPIELVVRCYDSLGVPIAYVEFFPDNDYIDLPDTTAMIEISAKDGNGDSKGYLYCKYKKVYAEDGRVMEVHDLLVPLYESVGWQEQVTMYSLDGRTLEVSPYEVEAYEKVGWYTRTNRLYISFQEKYNQNKQSGKHYENLKLVKKWLPTFRDTIHLASLNAAREETMNLWQAQTGTPIAYAGCTFATREEGTYATVLLTNISYKNVISLKVEFDVVDAEGNPTGDKKDYYYATGANIIPGESSVFVWKINNMVNPSAVSNFKVTEIVFEDASRWCSSK